MTRLHGHLVRLLLRLRLLLRSWRLSLLLSLWWCCLSLLLRLHLLLMRLERPHPQLRHVLLGRQSELCRICCQLFSLFLRELLGGHPSFGGLRGELLLHRRQLLGVWLTGRGHGD